MDTKRIPDAPLIVDFNGIVAWYYPGTGWGSDDDYLEIILKLIMEKLAYDGEIPYSFEPDFYNKLAGRMKKYVKITSILRADKVGSEQSGMAGEAFVPEK